MGTPGADPQTDPAAGGGLTPGAGSERQTRPGSAVARAASSTRSRCTSDSPASSSHPAALGPPAGFSPPAALDPGPVMVARALGGGDVGWYMAR
jgi:hypothetical protein